MRKRTRITLTVEQVAAIERITCKAAAILGSLDGTSEGLKFSQDEITKAFFAVSETSCKLWDLLQKGEVMHDMKQAKEVINNMGK